MYAIAHVFYGVPLTHEVSNLINKWEEENDPRWFETREGVCGFTTEYHGASPYHVGYCGICLGEFDECGDAVEVDESLHSLRLIVHDDDKRIVPLRPTARQIAEAKKKVMALDPAFGPLIKPIGVYFVFGSS